MFLLMSTIDTTLVFIVNNLQPHVTVKFVMSEFCCTSRLISVMSLLHVSLSHSLRLSPINFSNPLAHPSFMETQGPSNRMVSAFSMYPSFWVQL